MPRGALGTHFKQGHRSFELAPIGAPESRRGLGVIKMDPGSSSGMVRRIAFGWYAFFNACTSVNGELKQACMRARLQPASIPARPPLAA